MIIALFGCAAARGNTTLAFSTPVERLRGAVQGHVVALLLLSVREVNNYKVMTRLQGWFVAYIEGAKQQLPA